MGDSVNETERPQARLIAAKGARRAADDPRQLRAERDALMRSCDAQRRKIDRQTAELDRLRARLAKMQLQTQTAAQRGT